MAPRIKRILLGVAIGSAAFAGLIWVLIHTLGDHETLYQGKPLDFWVAQGTGSKGGSNEAGVVLETIVLPRLIEAMFSDTNDFNLRLMLIEQLNGLPGVTIRYTPADGRRAQAAQNIGELGPRARPAIPSLIKALKGSDSAPRAPAAKALGDIRSEPESVIPLLIGYMSDPQEGVPEAAVEALGEFGSLSTAAVPKLLPLLKIPNKDLRRAVTVALHKIDPAATTRPPAP